MASESSSVSSSPLFSHVPQPIPADLSHTSCPSLDLVTILPVAPPNVHPMQTRSKSGIVKKKAFLPAVQASSDLSVTKPSTYASGVKKSKWQQAMQD